MEAIIIAGGLGTRLREAVPTLPKCMAPINGQPFIHYLITWLEKQGVTRFIFALGYKSEIISSYLSTRLAADAYVISLESEPLGTGGAIAQAMQFAQNEWVLATNGDTLFAASIAPMQEKVVNSHFSCCLCLKPMRNFSRYGTVEIDTKDTITAFSEKKYCVEGLINGGLYYINKAKFVGATTNIEKFSFEEDFLMKASKEGGLCAVKDNSYFIDIGIPEDYNRAIAEFPQFFEQQG